MEQVRALAAKYSVEHELLDQGLAELAEVIEEAVAVRRVRCWRDLSIARGRGLLHRHRCMRLFWLVTSRWVRFARAAVMSRWRRTVRRRTPGVGLSIGVTRVVARILSQGFAQASRKVPSAVFVALTNDEGWSAANDVADALSCPRYRLRGVCECGEVR